MRFSSAIVIFTLILSVVSCNSGKDELTASLPAEVTIDSLISDDDKVSLSIKIRNNSSGSIVFNSFNKGHFEPVVILRTDGEEVVSKQGGWDLIHVDPGKLDIAGELDEGDFTVKQVVCLNKKKFDSIVHHSIRVQLNIDGKWHSWTLKQQKRTSRSRPTADHVITLPTAYENYNLNPLRPRPMPVSGGCAMTFG